LARESINAHATTDSESVDARPFDFAAKSAAPLRVLSSIHQETAIVTAPDKIRLFLKPRAIENSDLPNLVTLSANE
jgi:hypothetical protein